MSSIHIAREHALGRAQARQLASRWAETAGLHLGMECVYREGDEADQVSFQRAGVHGQLTVSDAHFVLEARLGLLLAAFKQRIHDEIMHNLDRLLAHEQPLAAFEEALARRMAGAAAGGR